MKEIHANFVVIKCGPSISKKCPFFAGNFRFFYVNATVVDWAVER